MSKFTTELRFVCETLAGQTESQGQTHVADIIEAARPQIFNFSYPIFDNTYKAALETKIIRHYYTREISEETLGLWRLRLEDKMNLIMPYYNQLYSSTLLEFNPLHDVDVTTTHETENNGTANSTQTNTENGSGVRDESNTKVRDYDEIEGVYTDSNATHWNLYSDTPQGGINGITNDNDSIANNTYLTNATKETDTEHRETDRTDAIDETITDTTHGTYADTKTANNLRADTEHNLEEYEEQIFGKRNSMTYSAMLLEFRKTFLNIDAMIIEELSDLFFNLWE